MCSFHFAFLFYFGTQRKSHATGVQIHPFNLPSASGKCMCCIHAKRKKELLKFQLITQTHEKKSDMKGERNSGCYEAQPAAFVLTN